MSGLLMPVNPSYTASYASHTRRNPPSTEAGTDMFVPIGTRVISPADGRVYGYGNTIGPMTGRWIGIDFDNGMRFRCMHHRSLSPGLMRVGAFVRAGAEIAISGASGYGYEDWSKRGDMPAAHTHVTLWESNRLPAFYGYRPNGKPWSIDFMQHVGGMAGGGSTPTPSPTPVKRAGKTVIYAGRDDARKNVFAIPEGGKVYQFKSSDDYNTYRKTIVDLNTHLDDKSKLVIPPVLSDVVLISQEKINLLILTHGAYS